MNAERQRPLVSVVIPTYNRAELLAQCLASAARQTYRPLEIIVADDGSNDGTAKVVAEFDERSARRDELSVIYLSLPKGGAPKARNAGVQRASGEFIHYLDSDDLMHHQKIELQVAAFERYPDTDFVWSLYSYFETAPPPDSAYDPPALLQAARHFQAECWPEIPGMVHIGLFRRNACARIGSWCESLSRWQDVEYMIRFTSLRPRVLRLDAVLYYLRRHARGQINDLYEKMEGVRAGLHSLEIIERGFPAIPSPNAGLQRAMSNFYKSIAETALQNGLTLEFDAAMRGATRHRPGAPFKARILCIRLVRQCCGSGWALKLLRGYHATRLASASECVD